MRMSPSGSQKNRTVSKITLRAPAAVARAARDVGVPCVCIAGAVARDRASLREAGFTSVFSLCDGPLPLERAMEDGYALLSAAAEEVTRIRPRTS